MNQNKILEKMLYTFIRCAENAGDRESLIENYEMQKARYQSLFEFGEENLLVCARCILSATRSLLGSEGKGDESVKGELKFLKPLVLCKNNKNAFRGIINRRIERLKSENSDNISDAILFMYISLAKTYKGERS